MTLLIRRFLTDESGATAVSPPLISVPLPNTV